MTAEQNLLLGVLALQMDFVTRDALVAATAAWAADKSKSLADVLVERGHLTAQRRALLEGLVQEHLAAHGDDAAASLASLPSLQAIREPLAAISDPDLQASLPASVSVDQGAEAAPEATLAIDRGASGRYRVLRPHAKGGVGEVFVAEDRELHREVALKEIQNRFGGDPYQRSRFLVEAEITGRLDHPGVVPVYSLGHHPDGRPFYTMRFVKGESLQQALAGFYKSDAADDPRQRRLTLRQLLGRFVAVCNTVAYAHSRGVLHRDLKPANILLGKFGETLVVDWGLAKAAGRLEVNPDRTSAADEATLRPTSGTGTAPTLMGSAIGTPAFMSPEQSTGRLDVVGPASDVYSLGVTLYAILTGKLPFEGEDVGEVLAKVRLGQAPHPRTIRKDIPQALTAVCLKAMSLRPEERYATPLALAADIEAYLADEPVSAYPEPLRKRLARWSRRHKPLVAAAAVLLITATAALAVSTVVIKKKQLEAEAAKRQAQDNLALAQSNFALARESIDKYVIAVSDDLNLSQDDFRPLQNQLLGIAAPFYEKLVERYGDDPTTQLQRGTAYLRLGWIHVRGGDAQEAIRELEKGTAILEPLAGQTPQARRMLLKSLTHLSMAYFIAGRTRDAERVAVQMVQMIESNTAARGAAVQIDAVDQESLVVAHQRLADVYLATNRPGESEKAIGRVVELRELAVSRSGSALPARRELAIAYQQAGDLEAEKGNFSRAESLFRKACAQLQEVVDQGLDDLSTQKSLVHARMDLARLVSVLYDRERRPEYLRETLEEHQRALQVCEELYRRNPSLADHQNLLAAAHQNLGAVYNLARDQEKAVEEARTALALRERLAKEHPGVLSHYIDISSLHMNIGIYNESFTADGHARAVAEYRKAFEVLEPVQQQFPDYMAVTLQLAKAYSYFGGAVEKDHGAAANLRWQERAVATLGRAAERFPDHQGIREVLSETYRKMAKAKAKLGRTDEGLRDLESALKVAPGPYAAATARISRGILLGRGGRHAEAIADIELVPHDLVEATWMYDIACTYSLCSDAVRKDAALDTVQRDRLAEQYARLAASTLRETVAKGYTKVDYTREDADFAAVRDREDFKAVVAEMVRERDRATTRPTTAPTTRPAGGPRAGAL